MRWDDVIYKAGEARVVAYRNNTEWAAQTVRTTGPAAALRLKADQADTAPDGEDLSFATLEVTDAKGDLVRDNYDSVTFSVSGPGEIMATDNGNPADLTPFPSLERKASSSLALAMAIVKGKKGNAETVIVTASGTGLQTGSVEINVA